MIDADEDVVAPISNAAARVREIPSISECIRQSLHDAKHVSLLVDAILSSYCKHYTFQRRIQ